MIKVVKLCHKPGRCCPTVYVSQKNTVIQNDDGEICTLSNEEWNILREKIKSNEI